MTRSRSVWFWLLLSVGGLIGFIAIAIGGFVLWAYLNVRQFQQPADTRDLRSRAQKLAGDYIAKRPQGALTVGLVQGGKTHFLGAGRVSAANAAAPDTNTLFEIGSITKVFTGIALARMAQAGRLALDDTLEQHLPGDVTLPAGLRSITLLQLATHTAGLPRLPANLDLSEANAANPYRPYTAAKLYEYLRVAKLDHPPGQRWDYSNLGVGLLGHLLERRAGMSYERLVREQVCQPLGLADTAPTLSAAQQTRLTPGHDAKGRVVSNWDFAVLAPAGALRSSAGDMLKFLQSNLATNHPSLGPALALAQQPHFKSERGSVALCWQIATGADGAALHWHNGGTGGYVSFLGFDQRAGVGVVLLSNTGDAIAGDHSLNQMGFELLRLAAKVSWD
jgi:CubicO group peptidase (beta-lactamase class C family)